jgi:anaerobic magnesium-protoporphyrin IX monomethyl ester cyclase
MPKPCLLISSPRLERAFPRGVMQIASFLEANGCPTTVLPLAYILGKDQLDADLDMSPQDHVRVGDALTDAIQRIDPAIIGVSNSFTVDFPDCMETLTACRRIAPHALTVIGGPHVTFRDSEALASPDVDVVVRGEGEWTMLDLVRAVDKGKDLATVPGITFKRDGGLIRTPDRPLGDLAELPPIDFGLLPPEFLRTARVLAVSNRGCAFRCSYCVESAFWQKKRYHPVATVVDEMEMLPRRYGNHIGGFMESMLDARTGQLLDLCAEIERRGIQLPDRFYLHARADCINESGIAAIRRAGIRQINLGVESASTQVLKFMNRTITPDQVTAACRLLRANGISVHTYWIIGHPGDTPAESDISFRFLKFLFEHDLTQTAEAMIFQPYPGTRFFEAPEKYGVEILHYDWHRWLRFQKDPVYQLADFSASEISAAWQRFDHLIRTWSKLPNVNRRALKVVPVG